MAGQITWTGGTNVVVQFDAGVLVLNGALEYVGNLTAGRSFNFTGAGDTIVNGPILNSPVAPINVGKWGPGTLNLRARNTFTGRLTVSGGTLIVNGSLAGGAVTVAGGTLGGTGVIGGPVNVLPAGTLSPGGEAMAPLSINNALTNRGTLCLRLDKSGRHLTNDTLRCLGNLAYGGTLCLAASGDPLSAGDHFKLFAASSFTGVFAGFLPQTPGVGLVWDTNRLDADGTLSVALGDIHPQISRVAVAGTNLVLSGFGGAADDGYSVWSATNLAMPLSHWTVVGTGIFDLQGDFLFTHSLNRWGGRRFYYLRVP